MPSGLTPAEEREEQRFLASLEASAQAEVLEEYGKRRKHRRGKSARSRKKVKSTRRLKAKAKADLQAAPRTSDGEWTIVHLPEAKPPKKRSARTRFHYADVNKAGNKKKRK